LGWAAIVVGALDAVEVAPALTFSTYHAGGWTVVGWTSFLGLFAVVLVLSALMLRRTGGEPASCAT